MGDARAHQRETLTVRAPRCSIRTRRAARQLRARIAVMAEQGGELVLEPSGLDRAVHPALFRRAGLPPPATGTRIFAVRNRARAGSASDGFEALVVKLVVGDVVAADIVPDLFVGPIGERRKLHDTAVVMIDFELADIRPGRPLIAAETGYPRVVTHQGTAERQHFAHLAAQQAQIDVAVEEIIAMPGDHLLNDVGIRHEDFRADPVAVANSVDQPIGFFGLTPGVDREDPDAWVDPPRHVDQGHAVGLKTRAEAETSAEFRDRPGEHFLRLLAVELDRRLAGFEFVHDDMFALRFHRRDFSVRARFDHKRACSRLVEASALPIVTRAASGVRLQNCVNDSPGSRSSRYPAKSRATVSSILAEGTRRRSGRPIAASRPSPPRRITSNASSGSPWGPRPVVPWSPISPVQCCAQA